MRKNFSCQREKYAPPCLTVYGNIEEVTQAPQGHGNGHCGNNGRGKGHFKHGHNTNPDDVSFCS